MTPMSPWFARPLEAALSGPLSRAELLDAVEARRQVKLEALKRALDAGVIIRTGTGTNVDPYRYQRGADSGSQVPSYSREPESSLSTSGEFAPDSSRDGGSEVPTLLREPGNHHPPDAGTAGPLPAPAWVTDEAKPELDVEDTRERF